MVRPPFLRLAACWLICSLGLLPGRSVAGVEEQRLDNAEFAQGLLDLGLGELLDFFLQQHRPVDAVEAALLARVEKLRIYRDTGWPVDERLIALADAIEILDRVVASRPEDPRGLRWRLELGYDLLYRQAEPYCTNLLYGLDSSDDRERLLPLAGRAGGIFEDLLARIEPHAAASQAAPASIARHASVPIGQDIRIRAAYFDAWAKFYRALALQEDDAERARLLSAVLDYMQDSGYLAAPHSQTGVRPQALLLAGIANRLLGRAAQAQELLDEAVQAVSALPDPAEQRDLLWVANVGRLEQIRLLRDAERFDEAAQAVAEARQYMRTTEQAKDVAMPLAIGLLESSALERQAQHIASSQRAEQLTQQAQQVLIDLARANPQCQDVLYRLLYQRMGQLADFTRLDAFDKSVAVAGLMSQKQFATARDLAESLSQESGALAQPLRPEVLFNLAVCNHELGNRLLAAQQFADVAEQYPSFSRAEPSCLYAVQVAADLFADPSLQQRPDVRETFLRGLQILTARSAGGGAAAKWQYDLGYVLQSVQRYVDAAAAYARVPEDDPRYLEAGYRGVLCFFEAAAQAGSTTQPAAELRERYQRAVTAARQFAQTAMKALATVTDVEQRRQIQRFAGGAILRAAAVTTSPPLNDPKTTLGLLTNFEANVGGDPDLVGQALQARIAALQALGQLQEAEQLMDRLLEVGSADAGAVLAGLLQAAVASAKERAPGVGAGPAPEQIDRLIKLATRLAAWADQHSGQLSKEDLLALKLQTAEAYQQAGRFVSALELFNQSAELDRERSSASSRPAAVTTSAVLEGQAECLYQLGRYREALSIYQGQMYRRAEWGSPVWWRAYLRSLQCHAKLNAAPSSPEQRQSARQALQQILQSIAAQRQTHPDLGGPELLAQFNGLEAQVKQLLAELP